MKHLLIQLINVAVRDRVHRHIAAVGEEGLQVHRHHLHRIIVKVDIIRVGDVVAVAGDGRLHLRHD